MSRRLLVVASCVTALIAPVASAGAAPPPMLRVTGRVLAPDGRPAPGARVVLLEPVSFVDVLLAFVCTIAVLPGLVAPDVCYPGTTSAVTDGTGRYTLLVPKGSRLAKETTHHLTITGTRPAGALRGPAIEASYPFRGASRTVPDLQLWNGGLSATPGADGRTRVHADPLPARYGEQRSLPNASLHAGRGAGPFGRTTAFRLGPVDGDREVDSRLFEHGSEQLRAGASGTTGDVKVVLSAAAVGIRHTGAPLSRGRACWTYGDGDRVVPYPGCRYTDGLLSDEVGLHYAIQNSKACGFAQRCDHPNALVVDLGAVRVVDLVVQRGCRADCPVDVSVDGTNWAPLVVLSRTGVRPDAALDVVPAPARYVRVAYGTFDLWDARELSVFGRPLPQLPAPQGLVHRAGTEVATEEHDLGRGPRRAGDLAQGLDDHLALLERRADPGQREVRPVRPPLDRDTDLPGSRPRLSRE